MKQTQPAAAHVTRISHSLQSRRNPGSGTGRSVARSATRRLALVTGGAGFIGTNVTAALVARGYRVRVLDSLSRPGVERNLRWLEQSCGERIEVLRADVRDAEAVQRAVAGAHYVFHFAAQVAVTTSLQSPVDDFRVNAEGTLNLLEACRAQSIPPRLLFTSTNKVYGNLPQLELMQRGDQYVPVDPRPRQHGIDELQPLDFHSPYGCSKGTADQYVLDYARYFGLPNVVFRMSCIYGPHQHGTEDQGWVAHFARSVLRDESLVFYGDGRQVRDLLFVDDLSRAMLLALDRIDRTRGQAFNVGGGVENAASLRQVVRHLAERCRLTPSVRYEDWRPGDQRYYISDTRRLQAALDWQPRVTVAQGLNRLCDWLQFAAAGRRTLPLAAASEGCG